MGHKSNQLRLPDWCHCLQSRPFGVALLVAGWQEGSGPVLYHTDPSGMFVEHDAKAIGSGSEGRADDSAGERSPAAGAVGMQRGCHATVMHLLVTRGRHSQAAAWLCQCVQRVASPRLCKAYCRAQAQCASAY